MIKIFTPPHTLHAAMILCDKLNGMNRPAKIVDNIDRRDPDLYIIYNAAAHNFVNLPAHYVVMQTEIAGTHWFNANYDKIIRKAIAVWDYCEYNQMAYSHSRMSIVTPGVIQPGVYKKDIDYLFYGWIEGSARRQNMLSELQKELKIKIITDKVSHDIWPILKRTKVVVNIHYYNFSNLELYRRNESLSFGCQFITEPKHFFDNTYDNLDKFISDIKSAILYFVVDRPHSDLMFLDNTLEIESALNQAGI